MNWVDQRMHTYVFQDTHENDNNRLVGGFWSWNILLNHVNAWHESNMLSFIEYSSFGDILN